MWNIYIEAFVTQSGQEPRLVRRAAGCGGNSEDRRKYEQPQKHAQNTG